MDAVKIAVAKIAANEIKRTKIAAVETAAAKQQQMEEVV